MKFGGTSVGDAQAIRTVADIVKSSVKSHPVIVVSAIAGFTNSLIASVDKAIAGDARAASRLLEPQFERHLAIAAELLQSERRAAFVSVAADARAKIRQLHKIIAGHPVTSPPLQDEIVAYGEHLSSQLITAVLCERGVAALQVDARRCIKTDDNYGRATPQPETDAAVRAEAKRLIDAKKVPVLGGFIGSTARGATTTLGRGGSDFTAAIVGAALDAREIQIWTDVTGVLTADPRVVPEAQTIPVLSYQEAAELAYFGAKVLHPKTIQPAIDNSIPVRVCNSRAPRDAGTLIVAAIRSTPQTIKAIAHKNGITTVQVSSARMSGSLRLSARVVRSLRSAQDRAST
jgi:aspartate kinase